MKTANEWFIGLPQREDSVYEFKREEIIALLEDYSDQQNKKLRERIEKMKLLEVISKTENEVSKEKSNDIIITMAKSRMEWRQAVRDRNTEIQRLTKENEELKKSVTPNPFLYPINSVKLKELVWKLDREVWAKVEAKEATTSWGREQTSFLISQYFGQSSNENTRLRELLGESKDLLLIASTGYPQIEFLERVKKLITQIDNELNPKP